MALALGAGDSVRAQTGGPGLSSGSGQGTGTGASSGIQRNYSGSSSGIGPGSATGAIGPESGGMTPITGNRAGTGTYPPPPIRDFGMGGRLRPRGPAPADGGVPAGPGAGVSFPDDPALFPFNPMPEGEGGNPSEMSVVQQSQLDEARKISTPGDRSLALQRVANAAIFSNQLALAHTALGEAAEAAVQERIPLVHDQRLIAIIMTDMNLAEAHLREGKDLSRPEFDTKSNPLPATDRTVLIQRAGVEWQRSAATARRILNPTFRSEMLYRLVDNMAYGSQTIMTDFAPAVGDESNGGKDPYAGPADQILRVAADAVQWIERPVWHDRALVAIATAASASKQFERGLEVARLIPQPEVRTDALVRLAEGLARFAEREARTAAEDVQEAENSAKHAEKLAADAEKETRAEPRKELLAERDRLLAERDRLLADRPARSEHARTATDLATRTYREAAVAVASIPLDDPRAILAGVLIDNLISVGRFEDARSTTVLYPDTARRMIALGAIAESQGRRGAAESARQWIARDVAPELRAELLRRVNNGILSAIEQNRSRDLNRVQ
jgi:hypothetical protein